MGSLRTLRLVILGVATAVAASTCALDRGGVEGSDAGGAGGDGSCDGSRIECGGDCIDPDVSTSHCGGCDIACSAEETCLQGSCGVPTCETGCPSGATCVDEACDCGNLALCGAECVDITSDPDHCSACGVGCDEGDQCVAGECQGPCEPMEMIPCYTGPAGTEGVGACSPGLATCNLQGLFGACEDEVLPADEACGNMIDEDCNGTYAGPPCLPVAPLVRYYLDEDDGMADPPPTMVLDSALNPLHLTTSFANSSMSFSMDGMGNRGLSWGEKNDQGNASALLDGTKVLGALNEATRATLEVVLFTDDASQARALWIGQGGSAGRLALRLEAEDQVRLYVNDAEVGRIDNQDLSTRTVIHAVFDSQQADPANRVAFYLDGALVPGTANVTQNDEISLTTNQYLVVGNHEADDKSFQGTLYYAAVYDSALSSNDVAIHATELALQDDTPGDVPNP